MGELPTRQRWRLIAQGLLRALSIAVVLVAVYYYVLPLDHRSEAVTVWVLAIGIALLVAMIVWQVTAIARSAYPGIRALEAVAATIPFFLLLFASAYVFLSRDDPATFSEPLSRTDAIYFTVTVFSTTGFGDISARGDTARLVVTAQMLLDLVILGLGIRVILGAVQRGRANRQP